MDDDVLENVMGKGNSVKNTGSMEYGCHGE